MMTNDSIIGFTVYSCKYSISQNPQPNSQPRAQSHDCHMIHNPKLLPQISNHNHLFKISTLPVNNPDFCKVLLLTHC